ncbi:hypothetical protein [Lentzea sp. NPDC092896]|uniref:hypothetical protein n=1 Tax=Lentzea sp. NPDC092896 TaxID=3364127 RepID=UPI00380953CF
MGDAEEQTLTEKRYFRGMNGDKLPSGTRPASMPAIFLRRSTRTRSRAPRIGMLVEKFTF